VSCPRTQCSDYKPGLDFEPLDPEYNIIGFFTQDHFSPKLGSSDFLNTLNCGYKAEPCSKPNQFYFMFSNFSLNVLFSFCNFSHGNRVSVYG